MTTVHSLPEREAKGVHQTIPTGQRAAAKAKAKAANKASSNTDSEIPFEEAVLQGKALAADITKGDDSLMRLGQLADNVEQKYANRTLQQFAAGIGIEYGTVKRCRTTYRQWLEIGAPAPHSYSAAQELAKHPDAAAIARDKPNITKSEARKLVQEYKERTDNKSDADGNRKHYEAWLRELQNVATNAIGKAGIVGQQLTPKTRRILRALLGQSLIDDVVKAGQDLTKLGPWLKVLLEEEEEEGKEEAPRSQPRRAA